MRVKRIKLDESLVAEWATVITDAAAHSVRVIACDDFRVVDFLGQLRFRFQPSYAQLSMSYRSPTGFWLEAPESLIMSAESPLNGLWTKYWLAHRRADIAAVSPDCTAAQFALLCDDYAKALLKKLPLPIRRRLQQQLYRALTDSGVGTLTASPAHTPTRTRASKERRSFRAMLAAISADEPLSAPA